MDVAWLREFDGSAAFQLRGRLAAPMSDTEHTEHTEHTEQANKTEGQIKVFLLDDHEVVRRGVRDMLETAPDILVVGDASTAVLDVRLPDGDGVSVCRDLRSQLPNLACLMLTSFADDEALYEAIMAGASGYVLKQIRGADLVNAIRTVAGGQSMLDAGTTAQVMERLRTGSRTEDPLSSLTEQERRILDLIGEGLTNRQIGERLFLAEKTVKNYVSNLLAKLGLQRRTQAAVMVSKAQGRQHMH